MSIVTFSTNLRNPNAKYDHTNRPRRGPLHYNTEKGVQGFDTEAYYITATEKYIGCVVDKGVEYNVRIMSDVWTNFDTYTVWDAEENTYKVLRGNDHRAMYCDLTLIEVDADADRLEHYKTWKAGCTVWRPTWD